MDARQQTAVADLDSRLASGRSEAVGLPVKKVKLETNSETGRATGADRIQLDAKPDAKSQAVKENMQALNDKQEPVDSYLEDVASGMKPRPALQVQQQKKTMTMLQYEPSKDYRREYYRIYLANVTIMDMINQTMDENSSLKSKIASLRSEKSSRAKQEEGRDDASASANDSGSEDYSVNKRRKRRRKKEEIERDYLCSQPDCGKSYG